MLSSFYVFKSHKEPFEIDDGNSGSSDTIDWNEGSFHKSTLTANCTYTFIAPNHVGVLVLRVIQDSTPRTITWPSTVLWPGNIDPILSQTNGSIDLFTFFWNGTNYFSLGAHFNLS